jgi:SnoaL-like domain
MADISIVDRYFTALCSANGDLASSLFAEHGVLDDYRGGHRAGREVIREFINARPPRTLRMLGEVQVDGQRLTAYTLMDYADGRSKTVRFIFTTDGRKIEHLCNSDIEFVPEEFLSRSSELPIYPRAAGE